MNVLRQGSARVLRNTRSFSSEASPAGSVEHYFVEFAAVGGLGAAVAMALNTALGFNTNASMDERAARAVLKQKRSMGLLPDEVAMMRKKNEGSEWGRAQNETEAAITKAAH